MVRSRCCVEISKVCTVQSVCIRQLVNSSNEIMPPVAARLWPQICMVNVCEEYSECDISTCSLALIYSSWIANRGLATVMIHTIVLCTFGKFLHSIMICPNLKDIFSKAIINYEIMSTDLTANPQPIKWYTAFFKISCILILDSDCSITEK